MNTEHLGDDVTSLRDSIVRWVDLRVQQMLSVPSMWGSNEEVEMQVLLLAEVRLLALRPDLDAQDPCRGVNMYVEFLQSRYPHKPHQRLSSIVAGGPGEEFTDALRDFYRQIQGSTEPSTGET